MFLSIVSPYALGQSAITYIYMKKPYVYTCIYMHVHTHIYIKTHKDFSGDIIPLVRACLAIVLLSFAFPATNQNEIGSKKACLSKSRSVEAFINPVSSVQMAQGWHRQMAQLLNVP